MASNGRALPCAPAQRDVCAPTTGYLNATDTRVLGLVVVRLGGGRRRPDDSVDPRVGLSAMRPLGTQLQRGEPFAKVHAATAADADVAVNAVLAAIELSPDVPVESAPILKRVSAPADGRRYPTANAYICSTLGKVGGRQ